MSADEHIVSVRFGDTGGDSPNARLGHQLHPHRRPRVAPFEVIDELRQVLDAVDVMVWRRADQRDPGLRVPQPGYELGHLVTRKLATFPGLRALGDLDLQLVCPRDVLRRHAEAARCHLLDLAVGAGAARERPVVLGVLAALARVRASAQPVHRDGQGAVRFRTQRAKGHGARDEATDDRLRRFHFLQRKRRPG